MVSLNYNLPIEKFQEDINTKFKVYRWGKFKMVNGCVSKAGPVTLTNTQKFVTKYFQPSNENGIFLYHSVGSGKTLSAVSILGNFEKHGWNALWVTRYSLKKDLQKALSVLPLKNTLPTVSYKQFSNIAKRKGELYKSLLKRAQKLGGNIQDPLYKTCVIIDEVHKLYNVKDLKPQERHDMTSIEKMIWESYSGSTEGTKVVLMSATPITDDPLEVVKLFNLIIEEPKYRFKIDTFKDSYLDSSGNFTKQGKEVFQDRIKDLVSFIDITKDPGKYAQVSYTTESIPISTPKFSTDFIGRKTECIGNYKTCKGLKLKGCANTKKVCMKDLVRDKSLSKKFKYQSEILKEVCFDKKLGV
jgi:hypothetical protein